VTLLGEVALGLVIAVIAAVALVGFAAYPRRREMADPERIAQLEAEVAVPIDLMIKLAEQRYAGLDVEFNLTFHQGAEEIGRFNHVRFTIKPDRFVTTERLQVTSVGYDPVTALIREANSDTPLTRVKFGSKRLCPGDLLRLDGFKWWVE
jgi:hypothetical protein